MDSRFWWISETPWCSSVFYTQREDYLFNQLFERYADDEAHFTEKDEKGEYRWQYLGGKKYKLYKKEGVRMGDWEIGGIFHI